MTVTKAVCPASPDGKHTFIHSKCIDCDAEMDPNNFFERMRQEVCESKARIVATRLVDDATR
jgi:hypothetical protein